MQNEKDTSMNTAKNNQNYKWTVEDVLKTYESLYRLTEVFIRNLYNISYCKIKDLRCVDPERFYGSDFEDVIKYSDEPLFYVEYYDNEWAKVEDYKKEVLPISGMLVKDPSCAYDIIAEWKHSIKENKRKAEIAKRAEHEEWVREIRYKIFLQLQKEFGEASGKEYPET